MYRLILLLMMLLGLGAIAHATEYEQHVSNVPATGVVQTVSAGTQIHEYNRSYSYQAVVPTVQMKGGLWIGSLTVDADTPLLPVWTQTKLKACAASGPCGLDDDGDGIFDRMAQDSSTIAVKLKKKVPYTSKLIVVDNPDSLRTIIMYAGATGDTLRLSYREFSNNMARQAFTEELTIPLTKTYPQDVAVKAVKVRIYKIDGLGMQYEILP